MPSKTNLLVLMLIASVLVCSASAESGKDAVVFKNGDRLSGHLTRTNSRSVQLDGSPLGSLTILWSQISEIRSHNRRWKVEGQTPSQFADFEDAVLREGDHGIVLETNSISFVVPGNQFVTFADQEHPSSGPKLQAASPPASATPPPATSFAVALNAPVSVVDGSQSQVVLGGNLRVLHNQADLCAAPHWFSALLLGANHNRTYKVRTPAIVTDTYDASLSLKNGIDSNGRVSWYAVADEWGNSSLGVGLQQSYGGGISSLLWSNECQAGNPILPKGYRFTATADASARYVRQRLYAPAGDTRDLAGLRVGETLLYAPLYTKGNESKERFVIDQTLWVMPVLNETQAIQAGGSVNFTVPVTKSFAVSLGEEDDFVNNAPKAKRKNYVKSSFSLTYSFPAPAK